MRLGFLTAPFGEQSLEEVSSWAAKNGFQAIEIAVWPKAEGATRRYAGTAHIDVKNLDKREAADIKAMLAGKGLKVSSLAYYPNVLDPNETAAQAARAHLKTVIKAASLLGVETVGTFVGRDKTRSIDDNFVTFKKVWPALVRYAADNGVKIAIENCPMIFSGDEWPGGNNLAYNPANWRRMFEIIPDANFGLNFDPSHLIWQFIDIPRAIREFGKKIFHVHAKDLEIRRDGLYEHGVMSAGVGWQVPRLCGLGEVNWGAFFGALYAVGYDDVVSIEHEDRGFEGTLEKVQRGFLIARDNLRPYIH